MKITIADGHQHSVVGDISIEPDTGMLMSYDGQQWVGTPTETPKDIFMIISQMLVWSILETPEDSPPQNLSTMLLTQASKSSSKLIQTCRYKYLLNKQLSP